MKSAYVAPTARRDEDGFLRFTPAVQAEYNNNLDALPQSGDEFTFMNGPYGGQKFEVVRTMIQDDGLTVVARKL